MAALDERGGATTSESPIGVVVSVILTLVLTGGGWWWHGTTGALLGALGGVVVSMLGLAVVRARRIRLELRERPVPALDALAPEQAMHVLSALAGRGEAGPSFKSPLLDRLEALRSDAKDDTRSAIVEVEQLRAEHPRSAAVDALLAELYRNDDRSHAALEAASRAIAKALDGGMNSVAFRVYADLSADYHTKLSLDAAHWRRLGAVLEARDDVEGADRARARAEANDQPK